MEKRGVIQAGYTPQDIETNQAAEGRQLTPDEIELRLDADFTKRAADIVKTVNAADTRK